MKATVPRKGDWPGRTYTIPSRPGSTYPSVTSIIGRGDQYPQRWEQYPLATKRGQIVHQRIAMHLAHSRRARNEPFDGVSLEQFEEAAPYVQAAINFIADHVKEIVYVEQTVYNDTHGYAGTVDLICRLNDDDNRLAVIDWKTGSIRPSHAMQLAAYAHAEWTYSADRWPECLPPSNVRLAVQLRDDSTYRVHPCYPSATLFSAFLAHLTIMQHERKGSPFGATWG